MSRSDGAARFLRCLGVAVVAMIAAAMSAPAAAAPLVVTIDDGPSLQALPQLSPAQRQQALLGALRAHRVQAALFVTVAFGADRAEGLAMAREWAAAGHRIGNHTVTHLDLHDPAVTTARYQQEVLDCDAVIRALPGYRPWLRYTFLHEGASGEQRDAMRGFLDRIGYRRAPVDIDSGDWQLEPLLLAALREKPQADLDSFKQRYLEQVIGRAAAALRSARAESAAARPRVLLLHDNLHNALWLHDVLARLADQGWRFVSPDDAFATDAATPRPLE